MEVRPLGLLERMANLIRAKMNELLGQSEDTAATLELSYERQQQMLQQVRRGVADVITAKRRLELQAVRLHTDVEKFEEQARRALQADREDTARFALQRKQEVTQQLSALDGQVADLQREQEKLAQAEQRLALKVETFRTKKETLKAQYSAAEAQVKIGESVTGLSEEMADVSLAVRRAEEKTESLRARAAAIDEMVHEGLLEDVTAPAGLSPVERELNRLSAEENVESDLAALKAELGRERGQLPPGDREAER
ncbi:MAG: PspA/IM30 family protein [Chloroflexota bacterium]